MTIPSRRLRFRPDGSFVILQITDLHLGASPRTDERTRGRIAEALEAVRPDLVVMTGDILEGAHARRPAEVLRLGLAPVFERGLPWAPVLGNHDDEGRLSREALFALLRSLPGCLASRGPRSIGGFGNYELRVFGSTQSAEVTLLFFDSHAYAPAGRGTYAWIRAEQIAWYRRRARQAGAPRVALAFLHIPLPEWDDAWSRGWDKQGERREAVCSPEINSGLFSAFLEEGNVLAAFCGHDHLNDYIATLHGIRLAYGRATGYGGYGRRGLPRGARVIRIFQAQRRIATELWPE